MRCALWCSTGCAGLAAGTAPQLPRMQRGGTCCFPPQLRMSCPTLHYADSSVHTAFRAVLFMQPLSFLSNVQFAATERLRFRGRRCVGGAQRGSAHRWQPGLIEYANSLIAVDYTSPFHTDLPGAAGIAIADRSLVSHARPTPHTRCDGLCTQPARLHADLSGCRTRAASQHCSPRRRLPPPAPRQQQWPQADHHPLCIHPSGTAGSA